MSPTQPPNGHERAFEPGAGAAMRVSDAEREVVLDRLREHTIAGRLSTEELGERSTAVLAARTRSELDAAVADLPTSEPSTPATSQVSPTGLQVSPTGSGARGRSWSIGVMSSSSLRGRWRPRETVWAVAVMGSCTVDLREAIVDGAAVTVRALALMGSVEVLLPPGVEADLTGIPIMGMKRLRLAPGPPSASWRAHVQALPCMGSVSVRSKRAAMLRWRS